jgi:hypothetical protein
MRRSFRSFLVASAFVLLALSSSPALAAPTAWERVDVTLHSEQAGSVMLVSGDLPAGTALPAQAELSVPKGAEIQWIGEILGGDPASDPELKYTKTTADGVDVYQFTLTKARTAQIEIPLTQGLTANGSNFTSSLKWTTARNVPQVRMSLRVPEGATPVTTIDGAALQPGDSGYSFYTKTFDNVKAGDTLDMNFTYSATPKAISAAATKAGTSPDGTVLGLFLLVIVVALVAVFAFRRKGGASVDDADDEIEDERPAARTSKKSAAAPVAEPAAATGGMAGSTKRKIVTGAIIGAFIVGTIVVGGQSTKPKMTGSTITETFSAAEPCATADIPLKVVGNADPAATAETLFVVLRPLTGMTSATYDAKTSTIKVGFCESSNSEASLKAAIAPTGLLAEAAAATTETAQ